MENGFLHLWQKVRKLFKGGGRFMPSSFLYIKRGELDCIEIKSC
jgi:hypothetical protein